MKICVTLLEPVGIRRILGLQPLQIVRSGVGLLLCQQQFDQFGVPRLCSVLLCQTSADVEALRHAVGITELIAVGSYIQRKQIVLRLTGVLLRVAKV